MCSCREDHAAERRSSPSSGEEMERLKVLEARMLAAPDQQISLTDPDSRSMATSGRGSTASSAATTSKSRSIPSIT